MAAQLKLFTDEACTTEVTQTNNIYQRLIGPENGIDPVAGGTYTSSIYVKNIGTDRARYALVEKSNDVQNYVFIGTDTSPYASYSLFLGNVDVNEVIKVNIQTIIPESTPFSSAPGLYYPRLTFKYYSEV